MSAVTFTFLAAVAVFTGTLAARFLRETMRGPDKLVALGAAITAIYGAIAVSSVIHAVPHAVAVLGGAP